MRRIPLEIQTLYAELIERLTALEAERAIGHLKGSFQTKHIKDDDYYYFQYYEPGGARRQVYVGRKDPALDRFISDYESARIDVQAEREAIERLCALLRTGGAAVPDAPSARVLRALSDAGVFHLGSVLVGTHAFSVIGNVLGVAWERAWVRRQDIDIAAVIVPNGLADIPETLDSLKMGFVPVPAFNRKGPSTSFRVRGRSLRVDLLIPADHRPTGSAVEVPRLKAAAQALPYLDYLLEGSQRAALIDGGGVLVNVPDPARFALHKLLVANERPPIAHTKREKDLRQAAEVLDLLLEERPGDLALAWDAVRERPGWDGKVIDGVESLTPLDREIASRVRAALR